MDSSALEKVVAPLGALPPGTVVVVNTETGETVMGATHDSALEAFETKYGWGVPAAVYVVNALTRSGPERPILEPAGPATL